MGVASTDYDKNRIFVYLTYYPRKETLDKKFGNLPITYERINLSSTDDYLLLEKAKQRYQFGSENESLPQQSPVASIPETSNQYSLDDVLDV